MYNVGPDATSVWDDRHGAVLDYSVLDIGSIRC